MARKKRKLDTRDLLRVVMKNEFVTITGMENISVNAMKLLFLTIAQCQMSDKKFYEYEISSLEIAELFDIDRHRIYMDVKKWSDELLSCTVTVEEKSEKKKKDFVKFNLVDTCGYKDGILKIRLHKNVSPFFLNIKNDFVQPYLSDFLQMKSSRTLRLWTLMQSKMESKKPYSNIEITFYISLEEIKKVTWLKDDISLSKVKRMLDSSIAEIERCCQVQLTYENVKDGRKIIGYNFTAKSMNYWENEEYSFEKIAVLERAKLFGKINREKRKPTEEEQAELDKLKDIYDNCK